MFSKPINSAGAKVLVEMCAPTAELGRRLKAALEATDRFHVECRVGTLANAISAATRAVPIPLLVVALDSRSENELSALEERHRGQAAPKKTIVLADGLADAAARRLLKLQVSDWLPCTCTDRDFVSACEQAMDPGQGSSAHLAKCTTFVSAVGGAGATTLSLAAASVLTRRDRVGLTQCCVADLNLQTGAVADCLDLQPNLQLGEIRANPERLDIQLLEVMLSRHASDLAVLAAPQSLIDLNGIGGELIGTLLDLAAQRFQHLIIDMPRLWLSSTFNVLRGSNAFHIVTDLTVVGLRQARRLADSLEDKAGVSTKSSVIVNKVSWFGSGGVGKKHAREVLSDKLAGFVAEDRPAALAAQNHGLLLSQIKKRNRIEADLGKILLRR
jgi:pilus assembly protein CpaE